jgi:hypothetical protein
MAVDQLEGAIRQFPGKEGVGVPDLRQDPTQGCTLFVGMDAPVARVGAKISRPHTP